MPSPGSQRSRGMSFVVLAAGAVVLACASTTATPTPRTIVIYSGARLSAAPERMEIVDGWVREEMANIQEDPTFMIQTEFQGNLVYPWEQLELVADTAKIGLLGSAVDARTPYLIYAHLHLMKKMDRIDEWLPGASAFEGFELERAILARVSDVWLYGRTVFDAAPHLPLEELMYATESGHLDAFILTARPDEFAEEREEWLRESPDAQDEYVAWFQQTFQDKPPGLRPQPVVAPEPAQPDSGAVGDTVSAGVR